MIEAVMIEAERDPYTNAYSEPIGDIYCEYCQCETPFTTIWPWDGRAPWYECEICGTREG